MRIITYTHKAMFFLCPVLTTETGFEVEPRNLLCEPLMFLSMILHSIWFFWLREDGGPMYPLYWKTKLSKPVQGFPYDPYL